VLARCARRDGLCPKRVKNGESLSLLLLLAVRRMRREHTRRMSKDADDACQLEVLWTFHHCFLDILAACFLKRCVNLITGRFCLSNVVSSVHSTSHNRPFLDTHGSAFLAWREARSLWRRGIVEQSQKTYHNQSVTFRQTR
jgi:hypothetical protein